MSRIACQGAVLGGTLALVALQSSCPVEAGSPVPAVAASFTGSWSSLDPSGVAPSIRAGHSATLDPVRHRMLVFGGVSYDTSAHYFDELWELTLGATPMWNQLTPLGIAPPPRISHTAVYDPVNDRMIVYGGWGFDNGGQRLGDLWALSLSGTPTWSEITPTGEVPAPRSGHSAIVDPVRDRMVVFGGGKAVEGSPGQLTNELWELTLAGVPTWTLRSASNAPSERSDHAAIYDPVGDRMIVSGGYYGLGSTWALPLPEGNSWIELYPGGAFGSGSGVYDSGTHRIVVFGGVNNLGDTYYNDVWSLSLSDTIGWTRQDLPHPPHPRSQHAAVFDPKGDRMVVFGGYYSEYWCHNGCYYYYLYMNDTPVLTWDRPTAETPSARDDGASTRLRIMPNPMRSSTELRWVITRSQSIRVDVLDVQGRIVRRLVHGLRPAGPGSVVFDGRDDFGREIEAGVYVVRLSGNEALTSRRVVLLP